MRQCGNGCDARRRRTSQPRADWKVAIELDAGVVDLESSKRRGGDGAIGGAVGRNVDGVRICPDKPHFGHLSGCTYSENESWRKATKDGIYAEMLADATQVWPFLVKYVMEKREARA